MSEHPLFSLFTEGQITLPEGYQDRTVNVFTSPSGAAPSFTISRDALEPGESLATYIDRQLALMEKHLKGWKCEAPEAAVLGDNLLQGKRVDASFLRDGKRIWQQQAVFTPDNASVLVFTISSSTRLSKTDTERFQSLLRSFRFHD